METETEAFDARIGLLAGELELALKWDRPSILLAVYASEFVRMEAEQALAARIRAWDTHVTTYTVSGEQNADIPLALARHPDREETVFFVSGLRWGGGEDGRNAYRALNLRREYFVEYRIRAVFWLTESEAARLPHVAPDFWAFRHRAVEFVDAPKPEQIVPAARELAWADWSDRTLKEDTKAKIALREGLLRDLPDNDETLAARADLLYTLGTLYAAKREYERAPKYHQQALVIFKRLADTTRQSWSWNSLGNIYSQQGRYTDAEVAYRKAIGLDAEDATPWNGLGTVYRAQGRYADAETTFRQAIDLDPDYADPWNGLGNVYRTQGRYADAEDAYRKAIELDPEDTPYYYSLGTVYAALGCYADAASAFRHTLERDPDFAVARMALAAVLQKLGREEEAEAHLSRARKQLEESDHYNWACLEAVAGNVEAALAHLERALAQAPGMRNLAARDPDLESLHGDPRFEALVGGGTGEAAT